MDTMKEYENAHARHFAKKWQAQAKETDLHAQAENYVSEFFYHANFGGYMFELGANRAWNLPRAYNDQISSLKTARYSSGTEVCFHANRGEPCKTFPPGHDIGYVGNGWNDQISHITVFR
jgi:hypothetical protein